VVAQPKFERFTSRLQGVKAYCLDHRFRCKDKGHPRTGHESPEGKCRCSYKLYLTAALVGDGWSAPRPGRFTPENVPVLIV